MSTFMEHVHRDPAPAPAPIVDRITVDEHDTVICPRADAGIPHELHSNAVWLDWQRAESWTCTGLPA